MTHTSANNKEDNKKFETFLKIAVMIICIYLGAAMGIKTFSGLIVSDGRFCYEDKVYSVEYIGEEE